MKKEKKLIPIVEKTSKPIVHTKKVDAPSKGRGRLSMTLKSTSGKNPHLQHYYVDPDNKIGQAKATRETLIAKYEKVFKKSAADFGKTELHLLSKEASANIINSLVADRLDYVKSSMTVAAEPVKGKEYTKTVGLKEEGASVTIHSPVSRKRGEQKEERSTPEKGEYSINVYNHIDDEGNHFEETLFEHHKRLKDGGASDREVANQAHLLLNLAEQIGAQKPDAIIIPPITGVDSDSKPLSKEAIQDKVDRSINHRVSKYLSDNIHFPKDEKGESISFSNVLSRTQKGEEVTSDKIQYNPLALGTKNFQAKKLAGHEKGSDGTNNKMQQSTEYRARETLKRFRTDLGLDPNDPEMMDMAIADLKEKFKGVKHVWLVDDNVDKGGTLFALSKIFEQIGVSSTAFSLFDMKGTQHPIRENAEALKTKSEQGRLQFKNRTQN